MISHNMDRLADTLGMKRVRDGFIGNCPICKYKLTFTVTIKTDKTLLYCHACNASFEEFKWKFEYLGIWPAISKNKNISGNAGNLATCSPGLKKMAISSGNLRQLGNFEKKKVTTEDLKRLVNKSLPAMGSLVETYIRGRAVTCALPPSIRFLPRQKHSKSGNYYPCMLSLVSNASGELKAIHRTFLKPDGSGKTDVIPAKMMLGPCAGNSVHLGEPDDTLLITEGIETALSVWQETGLPTWATLSTSGLTNLILPDHVRVVYICGDNDEPGRKAAFEAAKRFHRLGRVVKVSFPADVNDYNDLLMGGVL